MGFKKGASPKGIDYWHKRLWSKFKDYIRLRDSVNGYGQCISCGAMHHWKHLQAGHFIPAASSPYLQYHPKNINAQCPICNLNEGNYAGYREGMIRKYGLAVVEELEATRKYPAGFTADGLKLRLKEYTEKIKAMK